jgi:hypothetical protein
VNCQGALNIPNRRATGGNTVINAAQIQAIVTLEKLKCGFAVLVKVYN